MMKHTSTRRHLLRLACGAAATAGGVAALGQAPDNATAPRGYKFRGRILAPADIAKDSSFDSQDEPVYYVTDIGPDAGTMQVFRNFDELTAEHRGTIAFDSLREAQARMRRSQASQSDMTQSDIESIRRQQEAIDMTGLRDLKRETADTKPAAFPLPRPYGGWLYEDDNFGGRSTNLSIAMIDASWVSFDNVASSAKFSGLAVFSDLTWYRGSKLAMLFFSVTPIPAFSAFKTVHGVSWNDLISSWTCVSY